MIRIFCRNLLIISISLINAIAFAQSVPGAPSNLRIGSPAATPTVSTGGANYFVKPVASGTGNGSTWENAASVATLNNANIAAGATVWLAGTNYSGATNYTTKLIMSKSGTSASPITITRPLLTDAAAFNAAGWSPNFATQVIFNVPSVTQGLQNSGQIVLNGNYIVVNGRSGEGKVSKGIKVIVPQGTGAAGGNNTNAVWLDGNNNTIQYIEAAGPGPGVNHGGTLRFVKINGASHFISNNWAHGLNQPYSFYGSGNNTLIDHDYISDNGRHSDVSAYHDDIMEYAGVSGVTVRYSTWDGWSAEGVMMWNGAGALTMYGNVFLNSGVGGVLWPSGTNQTQAGPVKFYNNTLINSTVVLDQGKKADGSNTMGAWAPGSMARNNIYWGLPCTNYASRAGYWGGWPMTKDTQRDYEFYQFNPRTTSCGTLNLFETDTWPYATHDVKNVTTSPFVSSTDFRLNAATAAADPTTPGQYLVDRNGNSGTNRGAYQF